MYKIEERNDIFEGNARLLKDDKVVLEHTTTYGALQFILNDCIDKKTNMVDWFGIATQTIEEFEQEYYKLF